MSVFLMVLVVVLVLLAVVLVVLAMVSLAPVQSHWFYCPKTPPEPPKPIPGRSAGVLVTSPRVYDY